MRLRGKVALLTGAAAAIKGELMGFGGAAAHLRDEALLEVGAARADARLGRRLDVAPQRRVVGQVRQVGAVAAAAGITVLELATEQASLEDAFVDLTQDVVEFRAAARPGAGPTPEEEK